MAVARKIAATGRVNPLADLFLAEGLLTEEQLLSVREREEVSHESLDDAVVNLGFLTANAVAQLRAKLLNIPYQPLKDQAFDQKLLALVPEHVARRNQLIPLELMDHTLKVAMVDPLDVMAIDEVSHLTGHQIDAVISSRTEILEAMSRHYAISYYIDELVKKIDDQSPAAIEEKEVSVSSLQGAGENPVVKLINLLDQFIDVVRNRILPAIRLTP